MSLTVSKSTPVYVKQGNKYVAANIANKVRRTRFSVPLFTAAALGLTLSHPIGYFVKNRNLAGLQESAKILFRNFTGVHFKPDGNTEFNWRWMGSGLLPFALVYAVNKSGIFRSTNARLAKHRIPLRLN
ncbi:unnamed protein product [marine sediment metagenome]|uniref:Uncharacterized protein n=2 Tax=marine sediment metagenome TaxID=412755 RepID=X1FXM0_9ZZZZ